MYNLVSYTGNLLTEIEKKIIKHCQCYHEHTNIKIVFLPFKVTDLFIVKESVPKDLSLSTDLHVLAVTPIILMK